MSCSFCEFHSRSNLHPLIGHVQDVSTLKELCRRWYPETFAKAPPKANSHRALDDIKESLKELQFYREHIFVPQDKTGAGPQ